MIQSPRAPQIADQRAADCARSRSHPRGPTAGPGAEAAKGPHSSLACRRRDAAGLRRRLQGSQSESPTAAIPGRSYRAGTGRLPERFRRQLSRSGPAPMATRRLHVCSRKVPCPAARPPNIKSTFGQGLKHCDFTPLILRRRDSGRPDWIRSTGGIRTKYVPESRWHTDPIYVRLLLQKIQRII